MKRKLSLLEQMPLLNLFTINIYLLLTVAYIMLVLFKIPMNLIKYSGDCHFVTYGFNGFDECFVTPEEDIEERVFVSFNYNLSQRIPCRQMHVTSLEIDPLVSSRERVVVSSLLLPLLGGLSHLSFFQ